MPFIPAEHTSLTTKWTLFENSYTPLWPKTREKILKPSIQSAPDTNLYIKKFNRWQINFPYNKKLLSNNIA